MAYCTNCGVELDEGIITCPLCGFGPASAETRQKVEKSEYYPSDILLLYKKENRKHIWELSGIITFSAIIVCSIVDYVIKGKLTWSLFADTSVLASWIILTLILLTFRRYFIIIPGFLLTILATLFLFDLFLPPLNWFYGIGLPVTLAFFAALSIIVVLWKVAHFKGFNILAFAFIVLSGFCIVTEAFIDKYLNDKIDIHWSLIVAVSILPIALILLFVHYRMKRGKRLDSYFHV
jgi:hypothetical protein